MAHELIRSQSHAPAKDATSETWDNEEWDLVPTSTGSGGVTSGLGTVQQCDNPAARTAERDATLAYARDDETMAATREADARENRQSVWDRGDLRTWLIIAGMFFGLLVLTAFIYAMPTQRNASPPVIRVY